MSPRMHPNNTTGFCAIQFADVAGRIVEAHQTMDSFDGCKGTIDRMMKRSR